MSVSITLDSEAALSRVIDRLSTNWKQHAKRGRALVVTIEHSEQPLTDRQRRRYWKLLRQIAEAAEVEGRRFHAEYWDEFFKQRLIGVDDDGNGLPLGDLTVGEGNDVMRAIEAYATGELRLELDMQ